MLQLLDFYSLVLHGIKRIFLYLSLNQLHDPSREQFFLQFEMP